MRALDNTRRNPITSLRVSAQTAVGADSPAGCVVEFIGRTTGSAAAKQNITLRVDGENQITKSETFAAVEEQIERTFISPWPIVAVALSLIAVLLLALFVLGGFRLQVIPTRLSSADLLQLDQLASDAKNSDDKLAFLFDAKRREIHSLVSLYKPVPVEPLITLSGILKTLVLLGLIGMLLGMLFCYRVNTFLWGDYGEYYETLKERRKLLRNIVQRTFHRCCKRQRRNNCFRWRRDCKPSESRRDNKQWSCFSDQMHVILPFFPRCVDPVRCGSGRGEEPSRGKCSAIQIRLTTAMLLAPRVLSKRANARLSVLE